MFAAERLRVCVCLDCILLVIK